LRANRQKSRAKLVFFLRNRVETVLTRTVSIDLLNLALIFREDSRFTARHISYELRIICVSLAGPGVARSRAQLSLDSRQVSRAYLCRLCAVRAVTCIPVVRESAATCAAGRRDAEELGTDTSLHLTRGERGVSQGTRYTVLFGNRKVATVVPHDSGTITASGEAITRRGRARWLPRYRCHR